MKRRLLMKAAGAAAAYGALASGQAGAQDKMTLNVQYPLGFIFDKVFAELKTEFEKANPDLQVNYLPAYKEYEDAAQTGLRQAITKQLPDVGLQAINLQRLFVDRKIAVDISPFIAKEKDWQGQGFSPSMMALSTYGGKPYGLAFAASTPIIYINDDLVTKAGGDPAKFPTTWDGIFDIAKKVNALGNDNIGLFHSWAITGNWMWQALVFSNGGTMLTPDEKKVAFDGPAGQKGWKGELSFPQETVNAWVKKVYDGGATLFVHCNGDAAIDALLEAHRFASGGSPEKPRGTVGIHSQFIRRDQRLRVENASTAWTSQFEVGQEITIPLKNADGGYICSAETLARSWHTFAMTFDSKTQELTGWLDGWLETEASRWLAARGAYSVATIRSSDSPA